jgi:hypothetical protein
MEMTYYWGDSMTELRSWNTKGRLVRFDMLDVDEAETF